MNFATFDLNLLRVLDALLADRSTTRAADRLGLSQPAVSAALGRLRAALGDELFFRRAQGLEPTEFALSLELPLRETLDRLQTLLRGPGGFDPSRAAVNFRLSGSDFFAELLMPQLAARLARIAPRVRVHLVDLVPDSYVDTVERYEVDVALIPDTETPSWIETRPVFRSDYAVIARRDHPRLARAGLAPGAVIPLDLFCDLGHALFSPEGRPSAMGDAALARIGRSRHVAMSLATFSGVARAVLSSDLIALLPGRLAHHYAGLMDLHAYAAPMPVPSVQLSMVWHRKFSANPAHAWFRDLLADLLAPLDLPADAPAAATRS